MKTGRIFTVDMLGRVYECGTGMRPEDREMWAQVAAEANQSRIYFFQETD